MIGKYYQKLTGGNRIEGTGVRACACVHHAPVRHAGVRVRVRACVCARHARGGVWGEGGASLYYISPHAIE